jgi:plastocyanin
MRRSTLVILCSLALLCLGLAVPGARADEGAPTTATVSFGAWHTEPPLDRFPNSSPGAQNEHQLFPNTVTIAAGGTVNFIISGLHQVIVYDDGTQPEDINAEATTPSTGVPAGVPLIDDPTNRLYRGPDPSLPNLQPRDRVEVVHFPTPGTYLVICGVRDHFVNDGMYGFVTVRPER